MGDHDGALVQLRAYLAQTARRPNDRLPAERQLAQIIGASRGELRKALAELESEGLIWRHVGKGTFIGAAPGVENYNLAEAAERANPAEVMRARLIFEPLLASEASLHAKPADLAAMRDCLRASRAAPTWRQYETCDNQFHKLVADATRNEVISALYDVLAGIRRTVVWGRLRRDGSRPPPTHHSFAEHEAIVAAIAERDQPAASLAMLRHLRSVESYLFDGRRDEARPAAAGQNDHTATPAEGAAP